MRLPMSLFPLRGDKTGVFDDHYRLSYKRNRKLVDKVRTEYGRFSTVQKNTQRGWRRPTGGTHNDKDGNRQIH
jgi:hypothetical protein